MSCRTQFMLAFNGFCALFCKVCSVSVDASNRIYRQKPGVLSQSGDLAVLHLSGQMRRLQCELSLVLQSLCACVVESVGYTDASCPMCRCAATKPRKLRNAFQSGSRCSH